MQEVYSRNKKQSNTQTTSIHQRKIEWLPIMDNQSNKVLKMKSLRSEIALSESSKWKYHKSNRNKVILLQIGRTHVWTPVTV